MQLWLENATYYNLKEKSPNNIVCACSVAQSFLIVWDSMDCSPPGSSLFMGFPRQEYWSGLPLPPPGDLPDPGIEPEAPTLAGRIFTTEPPGKLSL